MASAAQSSPLLCEYNGHFDQSSRQRASVAFLQHGSNLLSTGNYDEAMKMFDASFDALSSPSGACSAHSEFGDQHCVYNPDTFILPPVDTYHEDECDVGPRPFSTALVPEGPTDIDVLQLIICYNKALVHHAKKEYSLAMQVYIFIAGSLSTAPANNISAVDVFHIAMRVFNNMGQIKYAERSEEASIVQFESAVLFAKRIEDNSDQHLLNYATVLSNWCRVQWMMGDLDTTVYDALEEVLRVRFTVLGWDHVDVASAHYNLGMAEYSRECNDKAMSHLMQYLQVASHLLKGTEKPELDPIPALIFVLLIKNDDKEEKVSQDLVWGLRTLQDKRQDLGPHNAEVASVLNFIGTLLFHQRELDYSLLFFQEELRLEEKLVGPESDVSVSVTCNNIGRILQELGRFPQAIHYYQRSLRHKFGDVVAKIEGNKGKDSAIKCLLDDTSEDCEVVPATMNLYSTVWYNMGLIHDKMGAYTDAIKAFQMSLKLRRAMLGEDHADVACLLYNIGVLQMEQQLLNEATDSFREALRIRRVAATGQLNDRHVVKTLQKLASLHKAKGNIAGALEACREVMHIFEVSVDFEGSSRNSNMGSTLRDIAELHHARGDLDTALKTAADSVRLLRTCNYSLASADCFSCVEQETAALLLIGSVLHERSESMKAREVFAEAAALINTSIAGANTCNVGAPSSLLPLLEVSTMLASSHCAPEA
eukprot:CAMPEP_0117022820 /NCGR_PEP_ID=MMETSP0472-20121206/17104_1 /TAXON_ID=693140 ORGANISM="Tiarina fusus, Strain LIS" /NCGR_SAMPLE_ID=MMETSP0472 /ASSEMBLY_ACC=CAM_ASM_000603 /LENGTH=706 /DNA_ID=CAMNT_0004728779 /DNA_START=59 /DNA_END=2179 /DNA_ORIENTATION=-